MKINPNQHHQRGFIQVSLILIAVAILTAVGVSGSYYGDSHSKNNDVSTSTDYNMPFQKIKRGDLIKTEQKVSSFIPYDPVTKTFKPISNIQDKIQPTKVVKDNNLNKNPITDFMEQGMEGEDVCVLQKILKKENVFDNAITCYYGSVTHWAVSGLVNKYGYFQTPDNFGKIDKTAMDLINQLYSIDKDGSIVKNVDTDIKVAELTFQDKIRPVVQNQDKKSYPLDEILEKETQDKNNTFSSETNTGNKDYGKDFQKSKEETRVLIDMLEKSKQNYVLLKKTVLEHKNKSVKHSDILMNQWANVAKDTSLSVPINYRSDFESRRDDILADRDYLQEYIKSLYNTLNPSFLKNGGKDVIEVITNYQNQLSRCEEFTINEWFNDKTYLDCGMKITFIKVRNNSYSVSIKKIPEMLSEIDNLVFDAIDTRTQRAERNILYEIDSISRSVDIVQSTINNMKAITRQAEYNMTQPIPSLQNVKCYTTTNDSIFDKNRTYNTRCEPYTQTIEQKCALQKARSVSTTGVYIGGLVDPKCQ